MTIIKLLFPAFILILVGCQPAGNMNPAQTAPGLPNPASVFCEDNGGQLQIREDAEGGQYGVCVFPDGSECDEWAYFRGECIPGNPSQAQAAAESGLNNTPVEQPVDGWQTYQDDDLGYRFDYPPDCKIEQDQATPASLTISGTSPDNEFWPQITFNHPSDREDFHPPKKVDLREWLTDKNLIPEEGNMPDAVIGGETAVHVRHDRTPQSYAFDRYYFNHDGQLYEIVIGHVGDHEDWVLYNRFLESIKFLP